MSGGFNSYSSEENIPERLNLLKKVISDSDADFVGLIDTFRWKEIFTPDDLRKNFGYDNVFCIDMEDTRLDKRIGLTILSKFDLNCEEIRIYNRNCIKSRIGLNGIEYTIFTIYLDDLSEDIRLKESEALLVQSKRDKTIVIGDFNSFAKSDLDFIPKNFDEYLGEENTDFKKSLIKVIDEAKRGEVIELYQKAGFINGMPEFQPNTPSKLFPGKFNSPIMRVDYVLHSKDVRIRNTKVLISDILDQTSDHFPIYFEIVE